MSKIKTKIVEHLATEAYTELQAALGEAQSLRRKDAFIDRSQGVGLDLAVLIEKLERGIKFIDLLR